MHFDFFGALLNESSEADSDDSRNNNDKNNNNNKKKKKKEDQGKEHVNVFLLSLAPDTKEPERRNNERKSRRRWRKGFELLVYLGSQQLIRVRSLSAPCSR